MPNLTHRIPPAELRKLIAERKKYYIIRCQMVCVVFVDHHARLILYKSEKSQNIDLFIQRLLKSPVQDEEFHHSVLFAESAFYQHGSQFPATKHELKW